MKAHARKRAIHVPLRDVYAVVVPLLLIGAITVFGYYLHKSWNEEVAVDGRRDTMNADVKAHITRYATQAFDGMHWEFPSADPLTPTYVVRGMDSQVLTVVPNCYVEDQCVFETPSHVSSNDMYAILARSKSGKYFVTGIVLCKFCDLNADNAGAKRLEVLSFQWIDMVTAKEILYRTHQVAAYRTAFGMDPPPDQVDE